MNTNSLTLMEARLNLVGKYLVWAFLPFLFVTIVGQFYVLASIWNSPLMPNPEMGQIVPRNIHGIHHYVTISQQRNAETLLTLVSVSFFGSLVGIMLMKLKLQWHIGDEPSGRE
jgi:hypothetical protein